MITVLVVLHVLIAMSLIGLILVQKSEGSASGAGFSGSASVESLMRPRARPNPITRATTILGICFFASSIGLALISRPQGPRATSIMAEPASAPVVPKINEAAPSPPPSAPTAATPPASGPAVPNN